MTWACFIADDETPHVIPVDDLREHHIGPCWCAPTPDEHIMVHHAMDQREEYEEGRRPS